MQKLQYYKVCMLMKFLKDFLVPALSNSMSEKDKDMETEDLECANFLGKALIGDD